MKILCVLSLLLITVDGNLLDGLEGHHHDHHHHDHHHHDHHHDDDQHQDFPLATGKEASHASARLFQFFNAVLDEQVQLPSDMPSYHQLPNDIQFSCNDKLPGYYADVNYGCQVYHMCLEDPEHGVASFLCPNATIFHQAIFACDWWFNVDCPAAPASYHLNEDLYKGPEEEEEENSVNNFGQQEAKSFKQFDLRQTRSASVVLSSLPLNSNQFVIPLPEAISNRKALNSLGSDYLPPKNGYLPPNNGYLPPTDGYLPPNNGYIPPNNGYLPPNNEYLPPQKGYIPPQ